MLRFFVSTSTALFVSIVLWGSTASADIVLHANLSNSAETPPVVPTTSTGAPRPASFGTADFVLNTAQTALTFTATVFNIDFTGSQSGNPQIQTQAESSADRHR